MSCLRSDAWLAQLEKRAAIRRRKIAFYWLRLVAASLACGGIGTWLLYAWHQR